MLDASRFLAEARELLPEAIALRRRIHAKPELGLNLPLTTAAVLEGLAGLDLQIAQGPSTSGVVATLTGTRPGSQTGRTILLRGDMDALPMPEDTGLPFASEFAGRMHACGHDAHTAMLVQAAHLLHRHRHELAGTVKFMFQPGEEGHHGARCMIEDGLLDSDPKPDAAFALHIFPNFAPGTIVGRAGAMMASADKWIIKVKGRGGHASAPHQAVDPVPVACEIVQSLLTMVTRRVDAFDPVVLTCGQIVAGTTNNVIPESVEMIGTLRSTSEKARAVAHEGIHRVATNIAAAHLCEATVNIGRGYPVTLNDAGFVDFVRGVTTDLVGADSFVNLRAPLMGAEDFSYVLQRMPGCLLFLGVRPEGSDGHAHVPSCHSNHMVMNEEPMAVGIAMHAAVAYRFLEEGVAA
ncbi:MAG TPA: M20 family metallopeptidase [Candidatus Sulfotelmatobacter sp.]|nr:M20 family metallopeptidase [Candidatus Sulfotelmatobacter sp.]